jgi:rhodanese-related sulfurtransferase
VSLLRRAGFERVDNLLGGMTAWQKLGLAIEKGKNNTLTATDIEGERR